MVKDANLVVRATSDGALAYNGTAGADFGPFDIEGTGLRGMALEVVIPATIVDTPVLQVNVHGSSTSAAASTDLIFASRTGMQAVTGASKGYIIPFTVPNHIRSVHFDFLVTGSTSASFSIVLANVVLNVGADWTRTVEFHS